jgi:hypothetical protein
MIPRPDSSRYPVVASGQLFNTETDGSIHIWTRRRSGMRKQTSLPICSLEVTLVITSADIKFKREWYRKPEDAIFAEEAAELIALAGQNFISDKSSARPRDEVYMPSSYLLIAKIGLPHLLS